jgi:cardiolipin synthase
MAAPVVAWLAARQRFDLVLMVLIPAALTDWLDGYAARRLGVSGELGAYLDPAADKILLVVSFVSLGFVGQIPMWLVWLVLGRDVVIVTGIVLLWWLRDRKDFPPLLSGKISTFFQIVTVLVVLLAAVFHIHSVAILRQIGIILTALFTAFSGINYVRRGIAMSSREAASSRF